MNKSLKIWNETFPINHSIAIGENADLYTIKKEWKEDKTNNYVCLAVPKGKEINKDNCVLISTTDIASCIIKEMSSVSAIIEYTMI